MSEVLVRVENNVGRLTLNRPNALHALTHNMCRLMTAALLDWMNDPEVSLVLIDHSEGRGFCAGGDVRWLYDTVTSGGDVLPFFRDEYQLNDLLFTYPKPTVVFMDGVVMGGGSGIAMPCRYRIATERTVFAMPETGIGLFPDVGGGWFLSRLPHQAGLWMALTGGRAKAADCLRLGLATHFVASEDLNALMEDILAVPDAIDRSLGTYRADPGPSGFAAIEDKVERAFSADTVEGVLSRLDAEGEWGASQAALVRAKSPTLQKIAMRQLREGAKMRTFADNMANEFRIVTRVMAAPDFVEGVRALIVDKDNKPRWCPAKLDELRDQMIDAAFAALPTDQEWRPLPQAREVESHL